MLKVILIIGTLLILCIPTALAQDSDGEYNITKISDPDGVALSLIPYLKNDNQDVRLLALTDIILTGSQLPEVSQAEKELLKNEPAGQFRDLLELGLQTSSATTSAGAQTSSISPPKSSATRELELKKGWDSDGPLSQGSVNWTLNGNAWVLEYNLNGALPNHGYTAGAHFFNKSDFGKNSGVDEFDGKTTTKGCWTRDGKSACTSFLNFGSFTTDSKGNGQATYTVTPSSGHYITQFYLRDGILEPQSAGNVVYHTGEAYTDGIETP
jgi:hypothetical protein